jgi:hypothetical protein
MKKFFASLGVIATLGFTACGSSGKASYTYTFSESSGCNTSETFDTLTAMCVALQSKSVNNDCALAARMAFFVAQGCTGTFQETP